MGYRIRKAISDDEQRIRELFIEMLQTIYQEIACGAAGSIDGLGNVAVFSVGSDGTDGPTDAAGGYVDGDTMKSLRGLGLLLT